MMTTIVPAEARHTIHSTATRLADYLERVEAGDLDGAHAALEEAQLLVTQAMHTLEDLPEEDVSTARLYREVGVILAARELVRCGHGGRVFWQTHERLRDAWKALVQVHAEPTLLETDRAAVLRSAQRLCDEKPGTHGFETALERLRSDVDRLFRSSRMDAA